MRLERPTLVYAAGCRFCSFCARTIVRLDRSDSLALVSLSDPRSEDLLPGMTLAERAAHWHLVTTSGLDLIEGEAIVAVLEQVTTTKWLGRVARSLRLDGFLTGFDRFVSSKRSRLGRFVADHPGPVRFP